MLHWIHCVFCIYNEFCFAVCGDFIFKLGVENAGQKYDTCNQAKD